MADGAFMESQGDVLLKSLLPPEYHVTSPFLIVGEYASPVELTYSTLTFESVPTSEILDSSLFIESKGYKALPTDAFGSYGRGDAFVLRDHSYVISSVLESGSLGLEAQDFVLKRSYLGTQSGDTFVLTHAITSTGEYEKHRSRLQSIDDVLGTN